MGLEHLEHSPQTLTVYTDFSKNITTFDKLVVDAFSLPVKLVISIDTRKQLVSVQLIAARSGDNFKGVGNVVIGRQHLELSTERLHIVHNDHHKSDRSSFVREHMLWDRHALLIGV